MENRIKLFSRDDATIHDPDSTRLFSYCAEHGIEPDQIHQYPSFDISLSDGSDWIFRCKGKIYQAVYSCGIYEDLYEITEEEAKTLLQDRLNRFFHAK